MKTTIAGFLLLVSLVAQAESPCYQQMSDAAYRAYAKDQNISVKESKSRADLFVDQMTMVGSEYSYEVELAEQYVSDSESGYFPGTKFKIFMLRNCQVMSIQKL